MDQPTPPPSTARAELERAFERKVHLSSLVMLFERLWPRLWLVAGVVGLFVLVSLAGVWSSLSDPAHWAGLGLFAVALLASIVFAARTPSPSRDEALRRIERVSGVPHRPASSYEDTLTVDEKDTAALTIWRAHRERLARRMESLEVGHPAPRTHRFDPFAVRALLVLLLAMAGTLIGSGFKDGLGDAFRFADARLLAAARLDAWVTPPVYTGKPPVMLADGARDPSAGPLPSSTGVIEAPVGSVLTVRSSGARRLEPSLEVQIDGHEKPLRITAEHSAGSAAASAGARSPVVELRYVLERSARIRVQALGADMAAWTFGVTPDELPQIALTGPPERSARGSLKLNYKVSDDYGVASAVAKVAKLRAPGGQTGSADPRDTAGLLGEEPLTGPRPPHERPPVMQLRLPRAGATSAEAFSHLELGNHPWAGLKVQLTLEATDVAGQVGQSEPIVIELPQRRFTNPIARAIIEQRRKLSDDPRNRGRVLTAIGALTLEPEGFIDDVQAYLGLRSVYHRLRRSASREIRNSAVEQLWHIAVRLEDGDLSAAERRLREAQDKLSKALEEGASEKEIAEAMQELREALNDFMRELAERNEQRPDEMPDGQDPNQQMLSSQDLDRMMKNIEEMAKNGSREQAQQMLSELRDLLDRMQSAQQSEAQNQRSREMMQKMDQLGNMIGKQQQLMDDTFGEMRKENDNRGQRGPRGQQQGRQGQRGQQQQGQQGQRGEQGEGQQGQRGRGQSDQGGLGSRQQELRDQLDELQRQLDELGLGKSDQLDRAGEAMRDAERSLQQGDLEGATEEQGRALDQLRQGAQQMAQEMLQNMPQRYGRNGDSPRDPLGRPQRSQGPDLGTSVKVPDEIDRQKAREILEELRRRFGQQTRPGEELDYIERLLKRF